MKKLPIKLLALAGCSIACFMAFALIGCTEKKPVAPVMPVEPVVPQEPAYNEPKEQGELAYVLSADGRHYSVSGIGSVTEGAVTVPSSYNDLPVTAIAASAFKDCTELTAVVISEGVTTIENQAFYNCSSLRSVELPDGMTTIGMYAFYGCVNLESIAIPEGVTMLQIGTFKNCAALREVLFASTVTSVKDSVFEGCVSLEMIVFPKGEKIGAKTFYGCSSLKSITIPDSVTTIAGSAFYHCGSLTDLYYGGTQEQWDAIEKSRGWDEGTADYTVHFTASDD